VQGGLVGPWILVAVAAAAAAAVAWLSDLDPSPGKNVSQVYFFGGISPAGSCDSLAVLDVATWRFSRPVTSGPPPARRCGHSSVVYRGRLWVVGGGSGRDLLRSGCDLSDVYCLDFDTMVGGWVLPLWLVWRQLSIG
jgi:hypothetical protein